HREHDPRREDVPDPLGHADRTLAGDAAVRRGAARPGQTRSDRAGDGVHGGAEEGRLRVAGQPGVPGEGQGVSATRKIDRFLKLMNDHGASDFHLTVGRPPMLRAAGSMETIRYRTLSEADFVEMMKPVAPARVWDEWTRGGDADFSYEIPGVARYRVNIFRQQRGAGAVFRVIPTKIMTIEQLGLPEQVRRI